MRADTAPNAAGDTRRGALRASSATNAYPAAAATAWTVTDAGLSRSSKGNAIVMRTQTSTDEQTQASTASARAAGRAKTPG